MRKRRLKPFVRNIIFCVCVFCALLTVVLLNNDTTTAVSMQEDYIYVNDYIFDTYYPVINQEEKILKPFVSDKVSIAKYFYEREEEKEKQKNSIIYHEGIYMQNSGIDYKSEEQFDVVSSVSGTVTNITDDTLLGKTIEIRNSNDLVFMYQSLGEVLVKKGDVITQGQSIAKSGTCLLNSDVKNGLHFELYKSGQVINPEKYYDKSLKELTDN